MGKVVRNEAPGGSDVVLVDPIHPTSGVGWQRRRSDFFSKRANDLCVSALVGQDVLSAEQSHKESCDLSVMLARYEKTGEVPRGQDGQFYFGDFSDVPDFLSARRQLDEAQASFNQLPARVRSRFGNDPHQLLTFVRDPRNLVESVELGILDPDVKQELRDMYDTARAELARSRDVASAAAASKVASGAPALGGDSKLASASAGDKKGGA